MSSDDKSIEENSKKTIDGSIGDDTIILGAVTETEGFDYRGIHKITGTKYDPNGYDADRFNVNGYDKNGFDKNGTYILDKKKIGTGTLDNKKTGWCGTVEDFIASDKELILKKIIQWESEKFSKDSSPEQISAWKNSIDIIHDRFKDLILVNQNSSKLTLIFEYILPREGGRRPDVILLSKNNVLVFEFKDYNIIKKDHIDQVSAYSRDIKNYHHMSHEMSVIPILIATKCVEGTREIKGVKILNKNDCTSFVNTIIKNDEPHQNVINWINSNYLPLPSIIQAAKMIFKNEELPQIKTAQSAGIPETIKKIIEIAKITKEDSSNSLVLVTGVPGSGKTLVGLQLVYTLDNLHENINGVFLSGNGPLVEVLNHALREESRSFVQPVYNFLREYGGNSNAMPHENIWIYDEAQRAWDSEKVLEKRGHENTEPDDFIGLGDRMDSWSLVIGLIGEGQTINTGEESGLKLWKNAIERSEQNWKIFCPKKLENTFSELNTIFYNELNLTKSLRSHIAEDVTSWREKLIDGNSSSANELSDEIRSQGFEIYITRDLESAQSYVIGRYDGQYDKRFGLIASSKDKILPEFGIHNDYNTTKNIKPGPWFNGLPNSTESCCALNSVITEYQCQGLELDFPIVCWGDDLRWEDNWKTFSHHKGAKDPHNLRLNSYNVLLSRGRDGMVIFVPPIKKLDSTYEFLVKCGLKIL